LIACGTAEHRRVPRVATNRCAMNWVVPPHVLARAAVNSRTTAQRARGVNSAEVTPSFSAAPIGLDESKRAERPPAPAQRWAAGRPLWQLAAGAAQKQRTIYDAHSGTKTPGIPVRKEGDPPSGDADVNRAYDYMGNTFDFYYNVFNRNSIDDNGMPMHGSV